MIEFKITKGTMNRLAVSGQFNEIVAEAMIAVYAIYDSINEHNEELGKVYRETFEEAVKDGTLFAEPEDMEKKLLENLKELLEKLKECCEDDDDKCLKS